MRLSRTERQNLKRSLLPLVRHASQRESLVQGAFGDVPLINNVNFDGNAATFAEHLITVAELFGDVDGEGAVQRLQTSLHDPAFVAGLRAKESWEAPWWRRPLLWTPMAVMAFLALVCRFMPTFSVRHPEMMPFDNFITSGFWIFVLGLVLYPFVFRGVVHPLRPPRQTERL